MTQYLLARVITLLALEPLLVLVSPLVLNEGIALMEASGTVAAFELHGAVAVHVAQMDTCESHRRHRADLWYHVVAWDFSGAVWAVQTVFSTSGLPHHISLRDGRLPPYPGECPPMA